MSLKQKEEDLLQRVSENRNLVQQIEGLSLTCISPWVPSYIFPNPTPPPPYPTPLHPHPPSPTNPTRTQPTTIPLPNPLHLPPPTHSILPRGLVCVHDVIVIFMLDLNAAIEVLSKTGEEAKLSLHQKGALVEQKERELGELHLLLQEATTKVPQNMPLLKHPPSLIYQLSE